MLRRVAAADASTPAMPPLLSAGAGVPPRMTDSGEEDDEPEEDDEEEEEKAEEAEDGVDEDKDVEYDEVDDDDVAFPKRAAASVVFPSARSRHSATGVWMS